MPTRIFLCGSNALYLIYSLAVERANERAKTRSLIPTLTGKWVRFKREIQRLSRIPVLNMLWEW